MQRIPIKKKPKAKSGYYIIKHELIWSAGLALLGAFFAAGLYIGNTKFDRNLIDLSDSNSLLKSDITSLKDTIKAREHIIEYMRYNSDSALNILSHMPYKDMTLDSQSFNKVQSTIENAGAALYLNKEISH